MTLNAIWQRECGLAGTDLTVRQASQFQFLMEVDMAKKISPADNSANIALPDLFLISPFKSVAQGLNNALREFVDDLSGELDDEAMRCCSLQQGGLALRA